MAVSRRRIITALAAVPMLVVIQRTMSVAASLILAAVASARPAPDGTSATRCAQCGSPDHTMLDPRCPLAPRVLA